MPTIDVTDVTLYGKFTGSITYQEGTTPPTEPPPEQGSGPSGGLITDFTGPNNSDSCKIDGMPCGNHSANKAYAIKQLDDTTLRFEVHNGDHTWSNDSDCAEVQRDVKYPNGSTVKLSYSFMIEPGGNNDPNGWCVVGEWHNDDDAGGVATSPPIAMELAGEKLRLVTRTCRPGGNPANGSPDLKYATPWTMPKNLERGKWYTIAQEFKTDQSNGYIKLTFDGAEVVNYKGGVGFGHDVYWMQGIYRSSQGANMAAQYKGLTVDPLQP